jgi:hypothetical protein
MPAPESEYTFLAPVLRLDNHMVQHYLPIPDDIADALLKSGTRRLLGVIGGISVRRAIHRKRDGERMVVLSRSLLREMQATAGDLVEVTLSSDPNPEIVPIDPVLSDILDDDDEAATRFYAMTPGRQRSLDHYVLSAKRTETKVKRALELAHKLRTYTLHMDQPGKSQD